MIRVQPTVWSLWIRVPVTTGVMDMAGCLGGNPSVPCGATTDAAAKAISQARLSQMGDRLASHQRVSSEPPVLRDVLCRALRDFFRSFRRRIRATVSARTTAMEASRPDQSVTSWVRSSSRVPKA
jgi:hypothetical protein